MSKYNREDYTKVMEGFCWLLEPYGIFDKFAISYNSYMILGDWVAHYWLDRYSMFGIKKGSNVSMYIFENILSIKELSMEELIEMMYRHIVVKWMVWELFTKEERGKWRRRQEINMKKVSGVYELYDWSELVYVWQSNNVIHRMHGHKDKNFDRVLFTEATKKEQRLCKEKELIREYKPKYNIMHNRDAK